MTTCVLLRLKDDDSTYFVDLGAGSVRRVEAGAEIQPEAGREFQGLDIAIVSERREAAATFPAFTD